MKGQMDMTDAQLMRVSAHMQAGPKKKWFKTLIPSRLDRLPWSRFHWLILFALGITWVLDGLEVTLMGAVSGVLGDPQTLHLSEGQIGLLASSYVTGAVVGSLYFGWLTDRLGRKKLFFITLAVYLLGVGLSAFSWDIWSFCFFRFLTGLGIGGEYSAINSAIDELIPARVRGRVDLLVNGTYWLGAAIGSLSTIDLLDPRHFSVDTGWRFGFGIGAAFGLVILLMRKSVPESPRWLVMHGRREEAEKVVSEIEEQVRMATGQELPAPGKALIVHPQKHVGLKEIARTMFTKYRSRSFLGLVLMIAQAFLYNTIFFTYALVLTKFYALPGKDTGLYLLPLAVGNFMGPLLLGHFFDTVGRKKMIAGTYAISATLLAVTGWMFCQGELTSFSQTALWTAIFFFASAASSAAYLTVSEIFPLETRGLAIALFFSIGTGAGGIVAPWLFGTLIGTGSRVLIFYGYLFAAGLMLAAAVTELFIGVDAEGKCLEDIAEPLSMGRAEGAPTAGASLA